MKNIILALSLFSISALSAPELKAQSSKYITSEITVKGNCGQCKTRIEEAAYGKGVKEAHWDKHTQVLKVVYNKEKTSAKTIAALVAKAGHDAADVKAAAADYAKLPDCCHYKSQQPH